MPVASNLSYVRSKPHMPLPRRIDRVEPVLRRIDRSPLCMASRPWKITAVVSAAFRLRFRAATQLPISAGGSFAQLAIAIASWTVAEALAACAAYAMALHPIAVPDDDDAGHGGPAQKDGQGARSEKPEAATTGIAAIPLPGSRSFGVVADTSYPIRPERTQPAPVRRSPAIATRAMQVLSGLRKARETRRTIAELQAYDDRMLRDIGLARHDIEYAVRHGVLPE